MELSLAGWHSEKMRCLSRHAGSWPRTDALRPVPHTCARRESYCSAPHEDWVPSDTRALLRAAHALGLSITRPLASIEAMLGDPR